ncbi:MAG: co-chaperone GroES family protein [Nitrososphaerales archaeon]
MQLHTGKQIIVVAEKILVEPATEEDRSPHGLYLPPTVKEKEKVQGGYVVQVGQGLPVVNPGYIDQEPWSTTPKEPVKYIPLQSREGDYAIFLRDQAIEIEFERKKYLIVPHSALLIIIRSGHPEDVA